ncbi:translocation protein SEC62-like [Vespa mandarinia]|uniref:translocation protein SEC62-like n=1 Tax=Vespa mandarinia TaxID=7446 RepID=UPI0016129AA8|nr:translocation protein SEC62-like [Vespa mandarinia]XP_046819959.1 translocation protein SEC62 [Vespa crabro]
MVERRKGRKRKDEISSLDNEIAQDKPSKEEYAVAKWIRNNVPSKKTKFDRNHNVEYFTGTRAVDALLENSPWSKTRFETREQVTKFLDIMLRHKFFHRAKKVVISEEELCKIRGIKKKIKEPKEEKKSNEKEKEDLKENKDASNKDNEEKSDERKEIKKKSKVRLEMHMEQYFVDCNDAYVWIYEPIPVYYWFFGTLVVLGAIGLCLFPLWPLTIRQGVYYLSVAAAGLLVFILALTILRMIVFCLLWVPTLGRCHFWLLPNLIADVGFFASFWPLYQYEYYGASNESDKRGSKKKKKKDKDSDTEEAPSTSTEDRSNMEELPKDETNRIEEISNGDNKKVSVSESAEGSEGSEEGSESEKSNTGRDFVMV